MFHSCLLRGVVACWLLLVGSQILAADDRPNIVLFVTDDQSPDIGCYGNDAIRTPNMDQLASEGVLFRNAYCTTASCSASRSVILSGLHNHFNGQYGHQHSYHHFQSFDRVKSLPVRLTEAGYETIRIGKYHVAPESVYKFDVQLPGNTRNPVQMSEVVEKYLASRDNSKPFFLYFCTSDPHRGGGTRTDLPHEPNAFGNKVAGYPGVPSQYYNAEEVAVPDFLPDTPVCRAELAMYYQSVSRIDAGLGKLTEVFHKAGIYDNSAFIFTSDHGMAFPGGKTTLYEPGMNVPMIVKPPAGWQGLGDLSTKDSNVPVELDAMISHVDLAPTIIDFAGALGREQGNPPRDFHGKSWARLAQQDAKRDVVYASHTFHEIQMYYPMRVVHRRRYKLIWNIAHSLPYPFASDLWAASTWQDRYKQGMQTLYGQRTVESYIHRPEFELFDLEKDPAEVNNLADLSEHAELLADMKAEMKAFQKSTKDPWIMKWNYE